MTDSHQTHDPEHTAIAATLVGMRVAVRMVDATNVAYALQAFVLVFLLAGVAWLGRSETRRRPGLLL